MPSQHKPEAVSHSQRDGLRPPFGFTTLKRYPNRVERAMMQVDAAFIELNEAMDAGRDVTTQHASARLHARGPSTAVGVALKAERLALRDGFGALLKAERGALNLDPVTLAELARINPKMVGRMEEGTASPSEDVVRILSLLLRRPVDGDDSDARQLEARFLETLGPLVRPPAFKKSRQRQIDQLLATGLARDESDPSRAVQRVDWRLQAGAEAVEVQNAHRRRGGYPELQL